MYLHSDQQISCILRRSAALLFCVMPLLAADAPCETTFPTASFSVPHVATAPELNTDPASATWSHAASAWIVKDCTHQLEYPNLKTEVRAFWSDTDLYLLFICPYTEL